MVRVDIETIVMAAGPVPSLIVLRERSSKSDSPAPLRSLSIQTGSFEAAAISRGRTRSKMVRLLYMAQPGSPQIGITLSLFR